MQKESGPGSLWIDIQKEVRNRNAFEPADQRIPINHVENNIGQTTR